MKYGIGIDLGTTNCCISVWRNNRHEIIYNKDKNTFPSIIGFIDNERIIGTEAQKLQTINTESVFYEIKRLIGRKITDISVQNDISLLSYHITNDENDNILIKNKNRTYTPEELSAGILSHLKSAIIKYLKHTSTDILINSEESILNLDVVITVPAYFNDIQREATKTAAHIAGLNCIRIINEPTAAALAYGININNQDINILVCDIGGGTTDITIVNINDGVYSVLASSGNSHLGGSDFDNEIIRYAIKEFSKINNIEEINNISKISLQELRLASERAKKILSKKQRAYINIKQFYNNIDLNVVLTRTKFEELCNSLMLLCLLPIEDVLRSSNLTIKDINDIIMVGGTTRIPLIREQIKTYFNKEPNITVNPDEVVAIGASIQAYMLLHKDNAFSQNLTLLDITSLSLGIEVSGGIMSVIIPRNSNIPTSVNKLYTNDTDFVDNIIIKIYEGERMLTQDNLLIGTFEISIEPCIKGTAVIEITFNIDVNGIITVTAEDKKNENYKSINVSSNKNKLSDEIITKLIEESIKYDEIDKQKMQHNKNIFTLKDLLQALQYSIDLDKNTIPLHKREEVILLLNNINEFINENACIPDEYCIKMINIIKDKYETLILNAYTVEEKKNINTMEQTNATTVYNDDDDEKNNTYEERNLLIEQCYEIKDMLKNNGIENIDEIDYKLLDEYIDNTLMWVYVKTELTCEDFKNKIDEFDNKCNEIFLKYNHNKTQQDLINTCNIILNYMNNIAERDDNLFENINNTLLDIKYNTNEINYNNKINELNNLFNKFYDKVMTNIQGTSIKSL